MTDLQPRHTRGREWPHDPWDDADETDAPVIERPRRSHRQIKAVVYTLGVLLLIGIVVLGAVGLWYVQKINPPGEAGDQVNFTITADDTLETVSERLEAADLISNGAVFRWYVDRQGGLELIPGYYRLRPSDHMGNVMRALNTPPSETYTKVTFPEGFTFAQMGARLAEELPNLAAADFESAATGGEVSSLYQSNGVSSLEGLLFPDTYQVSNGESEAQVVQRMVDLMERVGEQENIVELGYVQGLTAYQVLIVASMIEREAKTEIDRPLIARVILNRLRAGGRLEIDATLSYGQAPGLTFRQLRAIDSPYNTYRYAGLPPTPIANPGRASIEAVLNPAPDPPTGGALCRGLPQEECHYTYYVLADEDGNHAFAVTLAQHEANVQAARDAGLL